MSHSSLALFMVHSPLTKPTSDVRLVTRHGRRGARGCKMPAHMPPIDHSRPLTVIFGCGYVGSRLARTLLAEGWPVRACARRLERLAPLAELGATLFRVDAAKN